MIDIELPILNIVIVKKSIVIEKAILVLSIGENYPLKRDDGSIIERYYKFVAAIYPLDG